jgi:hypothetical protein
MKPALPVIRVTKAKPGTVSKPPQALDVNRTGNLGGRVN